MAVRRCLALICLFLLPYCGQAQTVDHPLLQQAIDMDGTQKQAILDLLTPLLRQGEFDQTPYEKYHALREVSFAYLRLGQIEQARRHTELLRLHGQQSGETFYVAKSYHIDGEIYDALAQFDNKLAAQKKALSLLDSIEGDYDKTEKVTVLVEIASGYRESGQLAEALYAARFAENFARSIEDIEGIASAYNVMGVAHQNLGNYPKALEYMLQTIELDRQIGKDNEVSTSLFNVATIYEEMGDIELAEDYYQQALELDLQTQNPDHLGYDYAKLGKMALLRGDFELARQQTLKAMDMFQSVKAKRNIGWMYNKLAIIELEAGELETSQAYLGQALTINQDVQDYNLITESFVTKAGLALKRGSYLEAHQALDEVEKNAIERRAAPQIEEIFDLRSRIFERQGRYQQALNSARQFHELYQSMNEREKAKTVAGLQSNINFLQREHRIQMLEKDKAIKNVQLQQTKIQRNAWISILLSVLFVIAAIGYREYTKRRVAGYKARLMEESVERKNAMLAEVSHELRSPLTALKLQVEALEYNIEDDPKAAYTRINQKVAELNQLIEDLYELARADSGLLKLELDEISVHELVADITEGYAEVVEHHGLKLEADILPTETDIIRADANRLKQVIVNLIRNSLNYTDAPGIIRCSTQITKDKVEIQVEDSAPGVAEPDLPRLFERLYRTKDSKARDTGGSGLGLSICKSLIDAHSGTIKASPSKLGGLKVNISLPKIHADIAPS